MARTKKMEILEDVDNKSTKKTIEETIEKTAEITKEIKFSKEQILELEEYRYIKDVVSAVLDDKEYSLEAAEKLIKSYLNKEVN